MITTRTYKYLLPSISLNDEAITETFLYLKKKDAVKNAFIGDYTYKLVDPYKVFVAIQHFNKLNKFLDFFRNHELFRDYYQMNQFIHIVVLSVPNRTAYDYFLSSSYSKMYTDKELEIFKKLVNNEVYKVLSRDTNLAKAIKDNYFLSVDPIELDSKLNIEQEILNIPNRANPL